MDTYWNAVVRDMMDAGMSIEEIQRSFYQQYPDNRQLHHTIQNLLTRISGRYSASKSFCRKAQMAPDGGMQSNFSVPNSEGEAGPGTDIDATDEHAMSGSYTDHARHRMHMKKREEERELKEKRKRRREILDRLATKPGEFLKGKKPEVPGAEDALWWGKLQQDIQDKKQPQDGYQQPGEQVDPVSNETEQGQQETQKMTEETKKKVEDTSKWVSEETDNIKKQTEEAEKSTQQLKDSLEDLLS